MTTLKGAIRSYNAAVHRAERAHQRRVKEAAKIYKQQLKAQTIADAQKAVRDQEYYIDVLTSVHKDCSESLSWEALRDEPPPIQPEYSKVAEDKALAVLRNFKPNLLQKIFGKDRKLRSLEMAVIKGKDKDEKDHLERKADFENQLRDWQKLQSISEGVCHRSPEAYKEAIAFFNPFEEIAALGSKLSFLLQTDYGIIDLHVKDEDIVPKDVLTTTSTGKLSRKNMPASKYHKLYQEHVCSSVLRVAREIAALLPLDKFVINASHQAINASNGKMEQRQILSVGFSPQLLDDLNFEALNPADAMKNFIHRMKYTATAGLSEIELIDIKTLIER